ncbi:carbon-nitrogen hydrolase family protein [Desulfosoma caldarium]|uniref:Putative amidohydrolase n=1 Tax=Desulfosoma caldarium TaxID=610254 RepID=A0A3N1UR19_9BACT|nr:carbon-nitrogen hydrolase family protein [Desulfosoma caldarium]ROQ91140.1 putative amidohydrolase [Desulfosoma caldarium]
MDGTLTVALAQVEGSTDPERNLETAHRYAEVAVQRGAHLLVFPEMFMGLPGSGRPPMHFVRQIGAEFFTQLGAVAKAWGIAMAAGGWEASPDPQLAYNTAVVLSPHGERLTTYRKLHLFDALNVRESDTMRPGDSPPSVVSIRGLRVGVTVCYDLRFPEIFRYLADQEAELVLVLSAWYQGSFKEDHWLTLLRARAIENTFYVAGCNLIGSAFCGRSSVFDPFGVCVASAAEGEDCVVANISITRVQSVRKKLPCLENRRRDVW